MLVGAAASGASLGQLGGDSASVKQQKQDEWKMLAMRMVFEAIGEKGCILLAPAMACHIGGMVRVGSPSSCGAWRLAAVNPAYVHFFQPRKQAASGQNADADFTSCLALRESKTTLRHMLRQPKTENQPNHRVSRSLVTLGLLSVSNNRNKQQQQTARRVYSSASPWGLLSVFCVRNASHSRQAACLRNKQ